MYGNTSLPPPPQCSTQLMTQLVVPSEYAPSFPLEGCNTDMYPQEVSYLSTACCEASAIMSVIEALTPLLIPLLFLGPLGWIADAIVETLGIVNFLINQFVKGCDCTPIEGTMWINGYRQNPQCVWNNYVVVLERLLPAPITQVRGSTTVHCFQVCCHLTRAPPPPRSHPAASDRSRPATT